MEAIAAIFFLVIAGVVGVLIHSQKIENYINRKCLKRKNKSR
jgi:hypothetical protein